MVSDLEIEIRAGSTPGTWEVEVDSPAGPATGTMTLDAAGILNRRRELAASVLASAVTSRSTFSALERPVRDVGHSLFTALFADRIYGRYTASLQQAGSAGDPLRVVLRIRDPELAGIPWETLFDPESGEYLCQREPVVRYVEAPQASVPLAAAGPLRILGMVAAPSDLPTLDTAEERRRLDDALGELGEQGLVDMVWVESGNWGALQQQLMDGPWHVLHVIAHGGVSTQGGVLALENEQTGSSAHVSAQRFARLLHACRPVPRLVVLNSCSSGESAADDLLSSTAAALVHSGISAAVAMQFAVTDPAALAFSRGFYQALARNIAVDEAVRLGRIAIDGTSEQTLEWVTPVIYLRTEDTRLFQLTSQGPPPESEPEREEEISQEAAKYGLYVQARAALRKQKYDEAVALLDSLITLDPSYRDATELRNQARRDQRLGASYQKAREAEDAGDLEAARRGFRSVIDVDPTHEDAQSRHDEAERQLTIASLKDELKVHADEEDWDAVLAVSAELQRLDPDAADPDGLATRARELTTPTPESSTANTGETVGIVVPPADGAGEEPSDAGTIAPPVPTPPAPPTPPIPPTPPPAFPWRRAIAVGAAVVLVLAGAGWWLLGRTHDSNGGSDAANREGPVTTGTVTCWDGSTEDGSANCPLPVGAEGLKTVFPSMDGNCAEANASLHDKIEVYECNYGDYVIRYSRWDDGYNTFDYFDGHLTDATTADWSRNGAYLGRMWTDKIPNEDESLKYRWIGAYENWPYDVTVKGVNQAARDQGKRQVQARAPEEIGLQ